MDLYCQRCGEPWDAYGVRHGDMEPDEAERFLKGVDCPHCHDRKMCTEKTKCGECGHYDWLGHNCSLNLLKRPFRAQVAAVLTDVLGDDIDGIAAELEDAEYLMGSEFWE